jgi:hypothetical protein
MAGDIVFTFTVTGHVGTQLYFGLCGGWKILLDLNKKLNNSYINPEYRLKYAF